MGVAAAIGGGMALSAVGSYLGGQSSNRAGRQSRDWSQNQYQAGQNRYGGAYFGSRTNSALRRMYDNTDPAGQGAAADEFNAATGGPVHQQMIDLAGTAAGRGAGIAGDYGAETGRLGAMGTRFQKALGAQYGTAGTLAAGAEGLAGQWGAGENASIDRNTELARKATGRRTSAALAASGFGNSTAAPAIQAGNDRAYANQAADQKLRVSEGQVDRTLAARSGRVAAALSSAGAQERVGGQNLANEYSRSAGGTSLQESNLTRDIAMRSRVQDNENQVLQSSLFNPWLGQGTSQFYPGASGIGQAAQNVGGAATAFGGQMYGQQTQQALMQQYLMQMRGGGGGGFGGSAGLGDAYLPQTGAVYA